MMDVYVANFAHTYVALFTRNRRILRRDENKKSRPILIEWTVKEGRALRRMAKTFTPSLFYPYKILILILYI